MGGVWVIRLPAPQKFSTNSTSSNLKHSHYDHGLWLYGLLKPFWLTHATCTCFKETALLFNVHLKFVLWISSCVQLKNTCSELTNSFLLTVIALSTAKTNNSEKATYFLTLISCSVNKALHVIHVRWNYVTWIT